jgi:RNA polymerase sigma-70 factor (ECF subfamily)
LKYFFYFERGNVAIAIFFVDITKKMQPKVNWMHLKGEEDREMNLNEEQMVIELKKGNNKILECIMNQYGDSLKRFVFLMIKDKDLAEDIVQNSFIRFYYNVHRFKGNASIYTYLYKIVLNECRQKMRKNWFKKVILLEKWEKEQRSISNFEETKIDRLILGQCIHKLKVKDREVILLYYYEDLSIDNICQITGEKQGTIKSRLKRARDKLKVYLKEAGFHDEER